MKRTRFGLILALALLLGSIPVARAQPPQPAIVAFTSSLGSVTVDEAEAGTRTTELSWYTANMADGYSLRLQTYRRSAWEPVFDAESVPLEPNGSRVVTVKHPLTFAAPTYLLSIVDSQQRIVDQRTLTIPYDTAAADPPAIARFEAEVQSVDAAMLASGGGLVTVAWAVEQRAPGSNLVFEQVYEDGSARSIELPRQYLWVPSSGQGPVAPTLPQQPGNPIRLRLRVVDVLSGNVFAEQIVPLAVIGFAEGGPPVATPVQPTVAPYPTALPPQGDAQIVSFSATPNTINPGAAVTLTWEVVGTGGVTIVQTVPNAFAPTKVVEAQSPRGSATVYPPDSAAYSVDFTLYTASQASLTRTVRVHCPYTFYFGEGDGCPASQPVEVQGAYQAFEGGFMVWRGDTHEIYVMIEPPGQADGGPASYFLEGTYNTYPETPADSSLPPLDRVAPVQGFGQVWANAPNVRDQLGWALSDEMAYTMTLQQVALSRTPLPEFVVYLTLPDGTVIGTGASHWRVVQPPL